MLLASVLVVNSVLAADLSIENVAPEQTVIAMSFDDLGPMVDRFRNSAAKDHLSKVDEMKYDFLDAASNRMADAWKEALEDKAMLEIIGSMSMGMAVYPVIDPETTAVTIGLTAFVNLGDSEQEMGPLWDEAMERAQEDEGDSMEMMEIAEVEVIRYEPPRDDDEDDDPFGNGGGMGMGMSIEDAFPQRFFMVRVDEHILFSTRRTQMERMLDIIAGQDVDGGLSESATWKGVSEYIGQDGIRMVMLTDHLGEMMKAMGQPFIVDMAKPMVVAMMGRIDAMGISMTAGSAPALATMNMGIYMPGGKTGLMKLMDRNSPREPLPGWLGADTVSYSRLNFDMAGVMPWIKSVINSNPMMAMQMGQAMESVEPMLEKILAGMGSRLQISGGISYPLTAESATTLWAMEASDPKAFTDAMAEVGPGMGMEPRDFQGHQIYSMDLGGMMGGGMGMGGGEMGVAVGGDEIFMGTSAAVEQALRSVGERSADDSAVAKSFAPLETYMSSDDIAMWYMVNVGASYKAAAEISSMQFKAEMQRLEQQDPELAEELAEMMGGGDQEMSAMMTTISECIGLLGWELMSDENGFKGQGWVLEPSGD